jgi:hypothetical protein
MTASPMSACPRFHSCSAPLCPLDPQRETRSHLRGEPVCGYLREFVKVGGPERVEQAIPEGLFRLITVAATELTSRGSPIYWPLRRAARQRSRLVSGRALRRRRRVAAGSATTNS